MQVQVSQAFVWVGSRGLPCCATRRLCTVYTYCYTLRVSSPIHLVRGTMKCGAMNELVACTRPIAQSPQSGPSISHVARRRYILHTRFRRLTVRQVLQTLHNTPDAHGTRSSRSRSFGTVPHDSTVLYLSFPNEALVPRLVSAQGAACCLAFESPLVDPHVLWCVLTPNSRRAPR